MYAASDLAGTMKLQYDATSPIIRRPCTARLDIDFLLKALQEGADGVLVVGCLGKLRIYDRESEGQSAFQV